MKPKEMITMISKIGENLSKTKSAGRVVFLKHKDDIESALTEGWSAKDIWNDLKKRNEIEFSYQMFMRYVKRFIKKEDRNKKATSSISSKQEVKETSPKMVSTKKESFNYEANAKSEDDLY